MEGGSAESRCIGGFWPRGIVFTISDAISIASIVHVNSFPKAPPWGIIKILIRILLWNKLGQHHSLNFLVIVLQSDNVRWISRPLSKSIAYSSSALSRDQTTLYVGSYDKSLYAISTQNGSTLWRYPTGFIHQTFFVALIVNELLSIIILFKISHL